MRGNKDETEQFLDLPKAPTPHHAILSPALANSTECPVIER